MLRHLRSTRDGDLAGLPANAFSAKETASRAPPAVPRLDTHRQIPVQSVHPLWIGLRAARANLWPGLCLQLIMLLIVLAYFRAGWARPWFDQFALLKAKGGFLFSMAAAAIAGAVLPEGFAIAFFQRGRITKRNGENLSFGIVFWAFCGLCIDLFYRAQGWWFGTTPTIAVLVKKVAVDQFIYSALFAVPLAVWCYEWKNRHYRTDHLGDFFTARFYKERILPATLANWGVWIPGTTLIYSLPPLLQIPLFNLALTFWALMLAYLSSRGTHSADAVLASSDKLSPN